MEPEEKKIVKIQVWDMETDQIIEMEIDQDDLDAMDAEEERIRKLQEEAYEEEREAWKYVRGED